MKAQLHQNEAKDPRGPAQVEDPRDKSAALSQIAQAKELSERTMQESSELAEESKTRPKRVVAEYNYDSVELYPDNPTDEDSLSRSALAELLAHRMTKVREQNPTGSFLINLDGPWGSGKSSFLKLLKKELHKSNDSEKICARWLVVEFNMAKSKNSKSLVVVDGFRATPGGSASS